MNKKELERKLTKELADIIKEELHNVVVSIVDNEVVVQEVNVDNYNDLLINEDDSNYFENDLDAKLSLVVKRLNNEL